MKKTSFLSTILKNTPYLLPYGQAIADYRIGMSTNETGHMLWDAISHGANRADLITLLQTTYDISASDLPDLEQDVDTFLSTLQTNAILENTTSELCRFPKSYIKIGPVTCCMQLPTGIIQEFFEAFCVEPGSTMQNICFYPYLPSNRPNGMVLVRNEDMLIMETDDWFIFLPQKSTFVYELHVSKDTSKANIYSKLDEQNSLCYHEIFHMLRFAFVMIAQKNGLLVVHSASILHNNQAWLFSGHSGAGKSTHTNLWHQEFNTLILNGDLNMIGIEQNKAICYGLPWCGTSNIFTTKSHPLGGIVYLKKALENKVLEIPADKEQLYLLERLISPSWTKEQFESNIMLTNDIVNLIRSFQLFCTKDTEAAYVMRSAIES
ncbi:MAG: PqqD family protein [Eubacteriales bacterium]|nr:PqqD family protein [Eubacteriales bacterium]